MPGILIIYNCLALLLRAGIFIYGVYLLFSVPVMGVFFIVLAKLTSGIMHRENRPHR